MNNTISKKQLREFGFLIGLGFPLFIGWVLPTITGHGFRSWTIAIGLPALFFAWFSPKLLYYPYKLWISLGNALGFINSHIILGIVFLVVLQPIAFVMRICGHDPLRKKKVITKTYRELRRGHKIDLKRIF